MNYCTNLCGMEILQFISIYKYLISKLNGVKLVIFCYDAKMAFLSISFLTWILVVQAFMPNAGLV